MGLNLPFLIEFIGTRGVSGYNTSDDKLIFGLNITATLTAFGSVITSIIHIIFTQDYVYAGLAILAAILYATMVILNHFKKVRVSRIFFATIVPIWIALHLIILGGGISESLAIATSIIVSFLFFEDEMKFCLKVVVYNILLFSIPTFYLWYYPPILGKIDYPLDEIVIFLICISWIYVIYYYYNSRRQEYISSLEKTNQELIEKKLELERFTYIASHDLKSPLRNINSFLGLIKRGIKNEEYSELDEYLDYVNTASFQMNNLLEGILSFSKLNHNASLPYELADLNEPLGTAMENIRTEIEEKNALLEYEELPHYLCNPSDFVIIFQNLIQNGIKYNESAEPAISIKSYQETDRIVIEIKDNGIGIPEEYRLQIFNLFQRLHTHQSYQGTGLGLGIVKKLIDKYGGTISVESEVGEYSIFKIQLPISLQNES